MNPDCDFDQRLRTFFEETFLFEFDEEIGPGTNLFEAGIIDSFGYIQLIQFLEAELKITLNEEEVLTNLMVSLDAVRKFAASKRMAPVSTKG